ncbi:MAG: MFS transporter [Pseudomonadales bacterium]
MTQLSAAQPDAGLRDLFANRATTGRYAAVLGLQLGQFLPLSFTALMLPIVFREQGLALNMFWLFSIPSIPTWLRPLWAPLVDQYGSSRLGRRKTWFLPCTLFGAAVYVLLSTWQPVPDNIVMIITVLTVASTIMTTQDIAIDGYMVENIADHERPVAAAALDICRNLSMFIAWGGLVLVYDAWGWTAALSGAAVLLVLFSLPAMVRREPPPPKISELEAPSLLRLLKRPDAQRVLPLCLLIGLVGGMMVSLYPTFLIDKGFSSSEVALIAGPATLFGTLIGASITAWYLRRFGYKSTLLVSIWVVLFGFLPIAWLALQPQPGWLMVFLLTLNGLALPSFLDVSFQAVRLKWTSKAQAGTEYTTQMVLMRAGFSAASAVGGFIAYYVGWFYFFLAAGFMVSFGAFAIWWTFDGIEALVDERDRLALPNEAADPAISGTTG